MYRENRRSRGGVDIQCLSARQIEVLELVAKGLTNEEIAAVLAISPQAYVAAIAGGALLVIAGGTVGIAYGMLPKKPVPQTQENLKEDVRLLKERLA